MGDYHVMSGFTEPSNKDPFEQDILVIMHHVIFCNNLKSQYKGIL